MRVFIEGPKHADMEQTLFCVREIVGGHGLVDTRVSCAQSGERFALAKPPVPISVSFLPANRKADVLVRIENVEEGRPQNAFQRTEEILREHLAAHHFPGMAVKVIFDGPISKAS